VYRVTDRKIGAGGYGEVFMALHLHYRKQLACKIVNLLAVKIEVSKRLRQIGKARDRSGDSDSIKEVLREWSRKKTLSLVEAEAGKILREVEILRTTSHVGQHPTGTVSLY
jgi:serine/threonine protein kinase